MSTLKVFIDCSEIEQVDKMSGYATPLHANTPEPGYFQRFHALVNSGLNWVAGGDNSRAEQIEKMRQTRNRAAELDNEMDRMWIERQNIRREADIMVLKHDDGLRAHLLYMTRGKLMDEKYETYCTKLAETYFENAKIRDPRIKQKIMDETMKLHIDDRLRREPILMQNSNMIARANYINQLTRGVKISYPWWNLWMEYREELTDGSGNAQSPYFVPERPNFWKVALLVSGGVTIALIGKYAISQVCSSHLIGTITQSAAKLPEQLTETDTAQNALTTTIQAVSTTSTDTSGLISYILEYGPLKSTLQACGQRLKDCFMWVPIISITTRT